MDLQRLKGWVFDLDGVVWAGEEPLPGAVECIAWLRAQGRRVAFLSNNSAASASTMARKLTAQGIPAVDTDLFCPLGVVGGHLRREFGQVKVLVSGMSDLVDCLVQDGHTAVDDPEEAEAVVMGRDYGFTYEKLAKLCRAVDRGVPFVVMNRDTRMPMEGGTWWPGLGALVAAVTAATEREPFIIGKPSTLLFRRALEALGTDPDLSVMVGDTPTSDVAGGRAAGMRTILTGGARPVPAPDLQVTGLQELLERLRGDR